MRPLTTLSDRYRDRAREQSEGSDDGSDDIDRTMSWPKRLLVTLGALTTMAIVVVLSLLVLSTAG